MRTFDLIVIGSGPAGQRAAVQASKCGHTVAVVERSGDLGGVCINTGTLPSKTLREAVLDLSGTRERAMYGSAAPREGEVTAAQLLSRTRQVMGIERNVVDSQLRRNRIKVLHGTAAFVGPNVVEVTSSAGVEQIEGTKILVAVGTVPAIPAGITVDHHAVLTSDDILALPELPTRMIVAGAGVIGVEYACMFAVLGVDVTLVDKRLDLLEMVDREVVDELSSQMRERGITLRLGEEVSSVEDTSRGKTVVFKSGKRIATDLLLVSSGRQGATGSLNLAAAGLEADARGRIAVDEHYRTKVPHIYAAGDVIGAPQLASTSAEQGRLAACHAFGVPATNVPELFPYGIYAIPEIGWVGQTEAELTRAGVPFETGVARYKEIARGQILGDETGLLKLIFHLDTQKILGVWVLGTQATEVVHIGQAVMSLGGTLDYFLSSVFNYPTLAECYKVAALNGYNKLRSLGSMRPQQVAPPIAPPVGDSHD